MFSGRLGFSVASDWLLNAYSRRLRDELTEIRSGAWDEKLAPKKSPPPEPVVSVPAATASSSSSQLSSIDSSENTPVIAAATQQQGLGDMEVDEADVTIIQQDEGMDAKEDGVKAKSLDDLSLDEDAEEEPKGKGRVEDENEDAEEDEGEDGGKGVEKARPTRGLSRKAPVLEPLEIPVAAASSPKSSRKGKGHKGLFRCSCLSLSCSSGVYSVRLHITTISKGETSWRPRIYKASTFSRDRIRCRNV
jgi:hypothetical protein